ncbi:hypothetical protein CF54_20765 [Streptomyces sp. Tu 6176]|nr:hypothetical protein CF54_20765 [Streptomyces sp. Tu 6176]
MVEGVGDAGGGEFRAPLRHAGPCGGQPGAGVRAEGGVLREQPVEHLGQIEGVGGGDPEPLRFAGVRGQGVLQRRVLARQVLPGARFDRLPGEHLPEQVAAVREQRPAGCPTPGKTFRHPLIGPVTVDCDALDLTGRDQQVVVHTAVCGSSSEEALRLLSVIGTQRMTAPG